MRFAKAFLSNAFFDRSAGMMEEEDGLQFRPTFYSPYISDRDDAKLEGG